MPDASFINLRINKKKLTRRILVEDCRLSLY